MRRPALLSSDPLTIYLNDHLGGAGFGVALARRAHANNRGTEFGAFLEELAAAIVQDKETLEQIIERLGRPRDRVKPAGGWVAEKLGRLKPNGRIAGYSPLSRVIELDGLNGGVQSKLALWRALRTIAAHEPRLDEHELDRLMARAEDQLERIAEMHSRAAMVALTGN